MVIEGGEGVTVRDSHGKTYLDAMAGLWCVNIGYGNAELGQAASDDGEEDESGEGEDESGDEVFTSGRIWPTR